MHTAAVVGTVFFICMLMNALTAHVYAWQVIASLAYAIFEISKEIFVFIPRRRVFIKNARKEFERIISIDCKERYWILWFIFKFWIDHDSAIMCG